MKNKYNINESVYDYRSKKMKTIKDFEVFDSLILYYFTEGGASPETKILSPLMSEFLSIVNVSEDEKEKQVNNVLKNLTNDLNKILS